MTIINVNGPAPYQVHIDRDLNAAIADRALVSGAAKVAVIHQPTLVEPVRELTDLLNQRGLEVIPILVPDAEAGKGLEVAGQCWDALGQVALGRRDIVIGFGGGAATDLAGFVAAAWMRGVKVIQVPTTLLAMVDAAVGGKTGINTAAGKNLVGAFHEPDSVFIDLNRLETLPREEIIAGSAEIIKTGFIVDPVILERYEQDPGAALSPTGFLPELIARSVQVKASVVGQDLKESGLREILNYGHTFGHAVELREQYRWRHGNAVAVGLMFIAELAELNGLIDSELVARHRRILSSVGLPTTYEAGVFEELHEGMTRDKKNREGNIRFVALTGVGETTRLEGPAPEQLQEAYRRISEGI